jgi:hypothetical protein
VTLIEEKAAFSVLNLRHHLLEELFFVFNAAAVNLVEGFLASSANSASEFCFANAALTVEHQEGQNARCLVRVQVEAELTLDVFLSDDFVECFVHKGGSC